MLGQSHRIMLRQAISDSDSVHIDPDDLRYLLCDNVELPVRAVCCSSYNGHCSAKIILAASITYEPVSLAAQITRHSTFTTQRSPKLLQSPARRLVTPFADLCRMTVRLSTRYSTWPNGTREPDNKGCRKSSEGTTPTRSSGMSSLCPALSSLLAYCDGHASTALRKIL